jgi:hypothetical protein
MGNGEQGDRRRQEERLRPRKEVEPQLVAKRRKKGWSSRRRIAVQFLPLPRWFVQPSEQRWKSAQEQQSPFRIQPFAQQLPEWLEQPLPQPQRFE